MISTLEMYLKERLGQKLPGSIAHDEFTPYKRKNYREVNKENAVLSGVLILLYPGEKGLSTIFIQRNVYNGTHSGQVSFPGGKKEDMDKSITETALREANEEVGIKTETVQVIGRITDVYIPVSNFHVTPSIGISHTKPNFIAEEREVKELLEVTLEEIMDPANVQRRSIELSNGLKLRVPTFVFREKVVWGATALMVNELKHLLQQWEDNLF